MNFFKRSLILVLVSSIFCSILSPLGTLKTYAAESNSVEVKAEVLSFDAKTYLENNEYYYNVEGNIYIDKTENNPVLLADTDNNRYIWYSNFAAYEADYHENGTPTYYVLQQDIVSIETGEVTSKIMYDNEKYTVNISEDKYSVHTSNEPVKVYLIDFESKKGNMTNFEVEVLMDI